ncbi:ABC transporter permease [uncultured Enterovirga sp.]|uniref:ABC transporter permease n=1 Tax=uncultured Enterovirga sp. TaxID=2026352 RepID=UPI0035C96799
MTAERQGLAPASGFPGMRRRRRPGPYRLARPSWTIPVLLFLGLFFVVPLGANILRSIGTGQAVTDGPLFYYVKLLTDAFYAGVIAETLKVGIVSTLICLVIGYPVAYFMVRHAGRWNAVIVFFLLAPLLTSIIMRTFGWRVLLARRGPLTPLLVEWGILARPVNLADEPIAVYLGLVHVLVPFMVLSVAAVLQKVDVRLEESARVLGAGPVRTFLQITLPLSIEGIATGCILVFVVTNGSFLTMLLLGGGQIKTLSLLIYQQFNVTQDVGFAAAMGNLLLLIAIVGLVVQTRFLHRRGVKA